MSKLATATLTEGPIAKTLLRMTGPMIGGIMANMLFNLVDTFFVSKLGQRPLAAMSFTFPMVFFGTGTAMGMGIGVSSVVSRAIGEGASDKVKRLTTDSLILAGLLVLALVAIGLTVMDTVFLRMGAAPDLLPLIRSYMVPWFCGIVFLVVPMVGNSAIRATGDTLTPSLLIITAGLINVVLDPLLIFGIGPFPRMELAGAALATIISYVVVFSGALTLLHRRYHMIRWKLPAFHSLLLSWKEVLYVALPAIATNQMLPIANGILTRIVSGFGESAVAAWGVGTRIESLMMSLCFALSTTMAPFTGQNFGAQRCDRVRDAMRFAAKYCFGINLILWPIVALNGKHIAHLFSQEAVTVALIQQYLWIVPVSYGAFGMMLQMTATFNSNRHPLKSFAVFSSRLFLFALPFALLGSHWAALPGMFAGVAASNIAAFVVADQLMRRMIRKEEGA